MTTIRHHYIEHIDAVQLKQLVGFPSFVSVATQFIQLSKAPMTSGLIREPLLSREHVITQTLRFMEQYCAEVYPYAAPVFHTLMATQATIDALKNADEDDVIPPHIPYTQLVEYIREHAPDDSMEWKMLPEPKVL